MAAHCEDRVNHDAAEARLSGGTDLSALGGSPADWSSDGAESSAQRLAERTRELATLLAVSQSVASTLELPRLLELILDHLKAVAEYAGASVCTIEGDAVRIVASRGATRADREGEAIGLRLPLARGGALWETIRDRQPAVIADVRGDEPLARAYREWLGAEFTAPAFRYVRAWLGVPLT